MHWARYFFLTGYLLIWTWVSLTTTPLGWAQSIDPQQQLDFANELFKNKQYRRAGEEYQRFAFFFPDHPQQRPVLYKSGESFLLAGEAGTALGRFKTLAGRGRPDTISVDADFMMVECYLQLRTPTQAVVHLHNIITKTDDTAIKDRAYHRLGWLHIQTTNWSAAQKALAHISPANRPHYRTDDIIALLEKTEAVPKKNPVLAGTLSIIPGTGQLYCERYEDALIAFIINVGLFWAASDAFHNDQPALGGLLTFIGLGFYAGNINGAISSAHKYNQREQSHYMERLNPYQVREEAPPPDISSRGLFFGLHVPF